MDSLVGRRPWGAKNPKICVIFGQDNLWCWENSNLGGVCDKIGLFLWAQCISLMSSRNSERRGKMTPWRYRNYKSTPLAARMDYGWSRLPKKGVWAHYTFYGTYVSESSPRFLLWFLDFSQRVNKYWALLGPKSMKLCARIGRRQISRQGLFANHFINYL